MSKLLNSLKLFAMVHETLALKFNFESEFDSERKNGSNLAKSRSKSILNSLSEVPKNDPTNKPSASNPKAAQAQLDPNSTRTNQASITTTIYANPTKGKNSSTLKSTEPIVDASGDGLSNSKMHDLFELKSTSKLADDKEKKLPEQDDGIADNTKKTEGKKGEKKKSKLSGKEDENDDGQQGKKKKGEKEKKESKLAKNSDQNQRKNQLTEFDTLLTGYDRGESAYKTNLFSSGTLG